MTRQVLAGVGSVVLTVFYLVLVAILSIQADGTLSGTVFSLENEVTGTQTPHVPWYLYLAIAALTAVMFFLASSKDVLWLAGVRRTFALTMLLTIVVALVAGVLTEVPGSADVAVGLEGWVQDWGTNLAVYGLAALLVLQLVRDRGGVEALPPHEVPARRP